MIEIQEAAKTPETPKTPETSKTLTVSIEDVVPAFLRKNVSDLTREEALDMRAYALSSVLTPKLANTDAVSENVSDSFEQSHTGEFKSTFIIHGYKAEFYYSLHGRSTANVAKAYLTDPEGKEMPDFNNCGMSSIIPFICTQVGTTDEVELYATYAKARKQHLASVTKEDLEKGREMFREYKLKKAQERRQPMTPEQKLAKKKEQLLAKLAKLEAELNETEGKE